MSAGTPSHGFLTVKDVCDRLLSLDGLDKHAIPRYQARIAEHNINGHVLLQCELEELKEVLGMTFGDWQLFRIMVLQMRGQSSSCPQTPSISSSDPLQMDVQSGTGTDPPVSSSQQLQPQVPGDYLNLSFEELRKTNTMSTYRSSQSLHNSKVSLGTSQSESSRASETDETSITGYSQRPGSTGNLLNRMDESAEEDDGVDREGITQFTAIAADGDYQPPRIMSSTGEDMELTTVVVHLEHSPTDKNIPKPISPKDIFSALEYQLSPEEPSTSTASDTTVIRVPVGDQNGGDKNDEREDKFKNGNHKHAERKLSAERKTSLPGAIAEGVGKLRAKFNSSRESLERDECEGLPLLPPEEMDMGDNRRYNLGAEYQGATEAMPLMAREIERMSQELDMSSGSLGGFQAGPGSEDSESEGNIISPIMKAQVVRDIDRMFENLQMEISQKQSQMDSLSPDREGGDGTMSLGRQQRIPRSPVQGEQQSHDLSLLAGYSTFNPPVRELQSVPESDTLSSSDEKSTPGSDKPRYQRTPLARQSQSTDYYHSEEEPASLMRTTSIPNRFTDSSVGFQQRQLQQSSSRTLDQSFDEFIMLSLEEQRKRRAPNPNAPHEEVERRPGRGTTTSSRYAFLRRSAPSLALQSADGRDAVFTVNISDTDSSDSGHVTQQAHI